MSGNGMKDNIQLNRRKYAVRGAQAVLQYGAGAMIDFQDQTLVMCGPEFWSKTSRINDDRLAASLGVDGFRRPEDVKYARFPEWYFCPSCRRLRPMREWMAEKARAAGAGKKRSDPYMNYDRRCPSCGKADLAAANVVVVCEDGHLDDFPWVEWAHYRGGASKVCMKPDMRFSNGSSASEGLEGMIVQCKACGTRATLRGAFSAGVFDELEKRTDAGCFCCRGGHPFRHIRNERCLCSPKAVQRGSSSVYFPFVRSSLVIPPYADRLNVQIEESDAYERICAAIAYTNEANRPDFVGNLLSTFADDIAREIGRPASDVEKILKRKWIDPKPDADADMDVKYRIAEHVALTGEISSPDGDVGDFIRTEIPISEYGIPHVKQVALIDKVRVVKALVGFSRVKPAMNMKGVVDLRTPKTKWYPAYEVKGEGIFIEFDQDEIEAWTAGNTRVGSRIVPLAQNYKKSLISAGRNRVVDAKFVMLHTMAHLLISELSFECGYSVASLAERLYCADESEGRSMAGIFIYTASGDAEGTLGGLVRQGMPDMLPGIFRRAVKKAMSCSNDPVCTMSRGQGHEALNLAACHACALLPETCCEERNCLLDRGLIVGTYDDPDIGFWRDIV